MTKYKLSELVKIKNGKDYKKLDEGAYPVFGSGGLMCYVDAFLYDKPSVLLPRKGTLSNIQYYEKPFWTVDTIYYTEINESLVNPYYLYLYLRSLDLSGLDSGASIPSMTTKTYYGIKVELPSLSVQEQITNVIRKYDDVIDNNNNRIALLEKIIENVYKEWFVRKRYPGYNSHNSINEIPEGWGKYRLEEFISFTRGVGYSSGDISRGDNTLLSMNNIRPYGGFIEDYSRPYQGKYKNAQIANKGDLIMSITDMTQDRRIIGYVGIVPPCDTNRVISMHLLKLNSDKYDNYFLYGLFNYSGLSRIIAERATGTNVLGMTVDILNKVKCLLPPIELARKYSSFITPVIEEIFVLQEQNHHMTEQRNMLLHRLMSGKLQVK